MQSQHEKDMAHDVVSFLFGLAGLLLFGLFLLSAWLTRLLLEYVINPLLDGLLDRHDGLVIFISGVVWAGVAGLVLFPWLLAADDLSWLGSTIVGALWGILCGTWVVMTWWRELIENPPTYDVVQVLDRPLEITSAPAQSTDGGQGSASRQPYTPEELEQLILGT